MSEPTITLEPILVGAKQAAALIGVSLRTLRTWHSSGLVPAPRRVGARLLWDVTELRAWAAAGAPCREEWNARRRVKGA